MISLMGFFSFERIINKLGEWREKGKREKAKMKKAQIDSPRNSIDNAGGRKSIHTEDGILDHNVDEKLKGGLETVVHGELNRDAKKVKVIRSGHRPTCDMVVGERVCKHRYSTICADDIDEIMNDGTQNCSKQTEDTFDTKANNNDNRRCLENSFNKKIPQNKVPDKVPEQLESQNDIKETVSELFTNCDKSSIDKQHLDSTNVDEETADGESKPCKALEVKLPDQLLKGNGIIMNGSPTKKATPSEVPLGKYFENEFSTKT